MDRRAFKKPGTGEALQSSNIALLRSLAAGACLLLVLNACSSKKGSGGAEGNPDGSTASTAGDQSASSSGSGGSGGSADDGSGANGAGGTNSTGSSDGAPTIAITGAMGTALFKDQVTSWTATISDAETDPSALTLSVSSSDTSVVPQSGLALSGSGASRTLTVTPASGATGSTTITATVSDGVNTRNAAFTVIYNEATVDALYPTNGANWNDYVSLDPFSMTGGTDALCDAVSPAGGCLHGGEARKVIVDGYASCAGLSASDSLGAFHWICQELNSVATFYSTGFASGKGLSDLIDAGTLTFKTNSVTLTFNGTPIVTTAATRWWTNPIVALPDNSSGIAQTFGESGKIYVLDSNRVTPGYNIDADKVALVIMPGRILTFLSGSQNNTSATGELALAGAKKSVVSVGSQSHVWIEGAIDGDNSAPYGVYLHGTKVSRLHRLSVSKIKGVDGTPGTPGTHGTDGNNGVAGYWTYSCLADADSDGIMEPSNGVSHNPTNATNGANGTNGTAGTAGETAYGVFMNLSSYNFLTYLTVSNVAGGNGGAGGAGGNGGKGGNGADCTASVTTTCGEGNSTLAGYNGRNGFNGGGAGSGGAGGGGGKAEGLYLSGGEYNTVTSLEVGQLVAGINGTGGAAGVRGAAGAAGNSGCGAGANAATTAGTMGTTGGMGSTGAGGQSRAVILVSSDENAFEGTLSIFDSPTIACYVSSGSNPGLVNSTCTTDGLDGSSSYPVGSNSTATLDLSR